MPIHGTRRPRPSVPKHQEPEAPTTATVRGGDAGAPPGGAASTSGGPDRYVRPQMPVSRNDAALNVDGSGVVVNPAASPKATLSAAEVLAAPVDRRGELLRRHCAFLSLLAGGEAGTTFVGGPPDVALARGGASARVTSSSIELSAAPVLDLRPDLRPDLLPDLLPDGGADAGRGKKGPSRVVVPLDRRLTRAEADALTPTCLLALEALLFRPTHKGLVVDGDAARLFLFLLGPDGLLTRGGRTPLDDSERFSSPKLLCWDFNGTVEKFGDGRTRGDLARTSRALERRGATSLITTTIAPEKPEEFLVHHQVAFGGYYGKDEVRPTRGNKQYTGIAAAHGISVDEAPHRMAILGDSRTDIPADLPGTVFFHNSAFTPAPAVELLLVALERAGGGSLARGLDALVGGLPARPDEVKRARVGDVAFSVEMRNSGPEKEPVWIPTVFDVELALGPKEVAAGIAAPPSSSDASARARFHLLVEHLADGLDEGAVAGVLRALDGTPGEKPALAAVERRLAHRETEVTEGRAAAAKLDEVFALPVGFEDLAGHLGALAALGDSEVAAALAPALARSEAIAAAAEPLVLAAVDAHAAEVRALAEALLPLAVPFFPSAPREGRSLLRALERVLKSPIPIPPSREDRDEVLAVIAEVAKTPVPGTRELLSALLTRLGEAHAEARGAITDAFSERRGRASELRDLAATAPDVARSREACFAAIAAAAAEVAR